MEKKQILNCMKLTLLFLTVSMLSFSAAASAQRVSITANNMKMEKVLDEITQQTGLTVAYSKQVVDLNRLITIDVKDAEVRNVLNKITEGTNMTYEIKNGKIYLSKKNVEFISIPQQRGRRITGIVTDGKGEPIVGANVLEKGTTNGIITDADGKFSLEIASASTLEVSYIGYLTQDLAVGNKSDFLIKLLEDTQKLDEVVVVGYGTQKKVNLTGSVSSVSFGTLADSRPVTNVSTALSGMSAGVQVNQTSGQPGSDGATIRIRGVGTLNNANPLIIIDGLEGSLDAVNPNDVENISILKDAASSAIYGARAANGVILVTTKKGKQGKINVSYSGRLSMSSPTNLIEMVTNYADFMEYMNESSVNIGSSNIFSQSTIDLWREKEKVPNELNEFGYPNYVAYPNTDWEKVLFKDKVMNEHNVSLNGATDKVSFLVSAGYMDNPGIVEHTGAKRYSFRSNVDVKTTDWLSVGNRTYAYMQNQDVGNFSTANQYINLTTPGVTPRYNGIYGFPEADGESATANNILYALNGTGGSQQVSLINTTLYSKVKFLKDFNYSFNLNYDRSWNEKKTWSVPLDRKRFSANDDYIGTLPSNLSTSYGNSGAWSWTIQNLLNYDKVFNGVHSLSVLLGHEESYHYSYSNSATKKGLIDASITDLDTATDMISIGGSTTDYSSRSFFGRVNYDFKQRYLFEANLRYDGSSRFASSRRYGYFPSFSGAWRISEENFMASSRSWLDNLKIRASWGKLGNNAVQVGGTVYNYPYMSTYSKLNYVFGNAAASGLAATSIANSLLKWESTAVTDIGVDLTMLHNRLTVEMDAYNKYTDGILYQPVVYYTMGDKTAPFKNIAAVRNQGVELTVGWKDHIRDFNYYFNGNVTYNINKVSKYKGKLISGWVDDNGQKIYQSNIGEVSTGSNTRVLEGKKMNEFYLLNPYHGNGNHFNSDGSVNISGGPKDGMIRTEDDMSWLKSMVAAGYTFYPNQSISQSKIWYGDYIYADENGDGIYGNEYDKCFTGTSNQPKYFFGFQYGANWKNIDFSMNWSGAAGFNLLWGPTVGYNSTGTRNGYSIMKKIAENHYFYDPSNPSDSRTNLNAKYARLTCNEGSSQNAIASHLVLYNGNYLKLKNLTIGYTLPGIIAKKMYAQSIRFYFSGENLLTITSFLGQDPEMGSDPGYVSIRQLAFGLNVTF